MSQLEAAAEVVRLAVIEEQAAERRHTLASVDHACAFSALMEARRLRVMAEQRLALVSLHYAA